jgi:hypothetical protein
MNMTPEDKAKLRAEQSRNSSRLYRLRKKEFSQQLEAHLDQVKEANERLMKEIDAYRELVAKLTEENNQLRQISLLQHRKYMEERSQLLEKLQFGPSKDGPSGAPRDQEELNTILQQRMAEAQGAYPQQSWGPQPTSQQ